MSLSTEIHQVPTKKSRLRREVSVQVEMRCKLCFHFFFLVGPEIRFVKTNRSGRKTGEPGERNEKDNLIPK